MFLLHILYLPFYIFAKIFNSKHYQIPESIAIGIFSLLAAATLPILYHDFLPNYYNKKVSGWIIGIACLFFYLFLMFVYERKDNYKKIDKEYKGTLLFGSLIDIAWVYYVYNNFTSLP